MITVTKGSAQRLPAKQKRRWRSGVVVTREIRKLSQSTARLFPDAPFERLVREVAHEIREGTRFTDQGMQAIHESAESYICETMLKANVARMHAKRRTLLVDDIRFAKFMTRDTAELVANNLGEEGGV